MNPFFSAPGSLIKVERLSDIEFAAWGMSTLDKLITKEKDSPREPSHFPSLPSAKN